MRFCYHIPVSLPAEHTWTEGGLYEWCTVCGYGYPYDDGMWSLRNGPALESTITRTYSYVYNGSSLSRMTVTTLTASPDGLETTTVTDTLDFFYSASGDPLYVSYNGTPYYYAANLQGDTVAILDGSGNPVVTYTYDAWGKLLSIDGTLADTLGIHNPLTYRGYVYDTETEFYYLQSRYYNPTASRFLNADAFASTGQGLLGNNMFAYCLNNPVNDKDPHGNSSNYGGEPGFEWAWDLGVWLGEKLREFIEELNEDAQNYDKENTDYNKAYDSNYFSSYNGTLVIRHSSNFLTSWAFGKTIFLNHNLDHSSPEYKEKTLNHEYGHIQQEKEYGTLTYSMIIALPSVVTNLLGRLNPAVNSNYFNMPWEYDADMRVGIQRNHASWAEIIRDYYFMFWRY